MNSGLNGNLYIKLVAGNSFNVASVLNDQTNRMIERMIIECNTSGGGGGGASPINIQLPTFAYLAKSLNFEIVITDTGNNAATNNIVILPGSGNTINQQSSLTIATNKGGMHIIGGTQTDWASYLNANQTTGGGGSGTVTSFSSGDLNPLFHTAVATATTTPALSFTLQTAAGNTVFAGPANGTTSEPNFRRLVPADFMLTNTATLDFPSTAPLTSSDLTITLTGAAVGDVVVFSTPAVVDANSCYTAWVSAPNTVKIRFNNYTAGAIDPASGSFSVGVFK